MEKYVLRQIDDEIADSEGKINLSAILIPSIDIIEIGDFTIPDGSKIRMITLTDDDPQIVTLPAITDAGEVENSNTVTLAIALNSTTIQTGFIVWNVPANALCRLVPTTSGTTTITWIRGQETY